MGSVNVPSTSRWARSMSHLLPDGLGQCPIYFPGWPSGQPGLFDDELEVGGIEPPSRNNSEIGFYTLIALCGGAPPFRVFPRMSFGLSRKPVSLS